MNFNFKSQKFNINVLQYISDVFDNIEYFSALYKWFNLDIIEK